MVKLIIEVIATNMDTGHVAVSQINHDVDFGTLPSGPRKHMIEEFKKHIATHTVPRKVGPILIVHNIIGYDI
ncbi:hypothetical protein Acj133p003 [Acinetobacter phage 133]|uniref:Uncharacterized protein n=1 Tax=Acinetobacter phage 133 TaxID=2919552 RepID=D9I5W9_9CAUD|nr:hypothetical protein Acj133p003 [Acinetobacter phage 133]ADJ19350.1 hypothetical protein Acj133p003 [Acinetobacter phage 133]